ncbi:hypothetical protein GCM10010124_29840 [Pilimelia terevasa]|uniref:Right handed beta helix domain-containing protein n=1 Tax=Pilimelia terevasa TaxID=53372 RepID=A0A8J3BQ75_9ACTN|nr:right-handed parallel beta-helix repeat-containing protein [Pilimelia terevasa]GGK35185.1 hypothetical protein GCM10010124_29840 [Pilimelia terevasa]
MAGRWTGVSATPPPARTERVLATRMPLPAVAAISVIAAAAVAVALLAVVRPPAPAPAPFLAAPAAAPAADSPAPRRAAACPAATVRVAGPGQLAAALAAAGPGTAIRLADGVYRGRFLLRASGTPAAPLFVCGGPGAVLDGGGRPHGRVLHLAGASFVRLVGFTVRNGGTGLLVDRGRRVVVQGLTVEQVGETAVHLRHGATDNLVAGNTLRATGLRRPAGGAGVTVGSAAGHWCAVSACLPDACDRNVIRDNRISATTTEAVVAREGTSGGRIAGNTFDGSRLTGAYADAWVTVRGNGWEVRGNRGQLSHGDGFRAGQVVGGWGRGNVFAGNTAQVDGPGWGFHVAPGLDNHVLCDNASTGARKGLSNVTCQPA